MRSFLCRPEGQVPETAVDRPSENLGVTDFSLSVTLSSGQLFRWKQGLSPGQSGDGGQAKGTVPAFSGWIGPSLVTVSQQDSRLFFTGCPPETIRQFFALDIDLLALTRAIDQDPIIHGALRKFLGLRVVRQDPWECMAAFILSSFNNIPRLTGMIETLSVRFGESAETAYRFPTPERLAKVSERTLRACGLGFRAPYLRAAAQRVDSGKIRPEEWRALDDDELRRKLREIPGIGEKVAECVMLFACERAGAFPVDVWIGRMMRRWYFRGRKVPDRKIRQFARRHFGPECGWAQQYLYCSARAGSVRTSFERTEPSGAMS